MVGIICGGKPEEILIVFGSQHAASIADMFSVICKSPGIVSLLGQWNGCDIICKGTKMISQGRYQVPPPDYHQG
jgi:hypothetical protein